MQTVNIGFVLKDAEHYNVIKAAIIEALERRCTDMDVNLFCCDSREAIAHSGRWPEIWVIESGLAVDNGSLPDALGQKPDKSGPFVILVSRDTTRDASVYLNPWQSTEPIVDKIIGYMSLLASPAPQATETASKTARKLLDAEYIPNQLLAFSEKVLRRNNHETIIADIYSYCENLNLDSVTIYVDKSGQFEVFPARSIAQEEAIEYLAQLKGYSADVLDGNLVISYDDLVLVLRNMPQSQPELIEKARYFFGMILRSAYSRLQSIKLEHVAVRQRALLNEVMGLLHRRLDNLNDKQRNQALQSSKITMELVETVDNAVVRLKVGEEEKKILKHIIFAKIQMLVEVNNWGIDNLVELDNVLDNVVSTRSAGNANADAIVESERRKASSPNASGVNR